MKKGNKLLLIASLSLTGALLAGCQTNADNSSIDYSQKLIDGDVRAIRLVDDIPYARVNEEIDLDEYVNIVMRDGSFSKEKKYLIENKDPDLLVNGHKITPTKVKKYEFKLHCNGVYLYVRKIDCRSELNIQAIELFKELNAKSGQNYTMEIGTYSTESGRFHYDGMTFLHNDNYVLIYDSLNPKKQDNSTILSLLNDGKAYWGELDGNGKPKFERGYVSNYNYYYFWMPLSLNGELLESSFDDLTGKETLKGGKELEQPFLNYGLAQLIERNGYTYNSLYVQKITDEYGEDGNLGTDGKLDTAYLTATVNGTSSSGVAFTDEEYVSVRLTKIGSSTYSPLEEAIKDDSYVPVPLTGSELKNAFDKVAESGNYTVTTSFTPVDENKKALSEDQVDDTSAMKIIFSTKSQLKQINTVTAEGVEGALYEGGLLASKKAYFDKNGATYEGIYKPAANGESESTKVTALEGVTSYKDYSGAKDYLVHDFTALDFSSVNWKDSVTEDGVITFNGDVGDNDGSTRNNTLFEKLFNQMANISYSSSEGEGSTMRIGTMLTRANQYPSSTFAYTWGSAYDAFSADLTTNEVTVSALMQFLFSDVTQQYVLAEYTIRQIGTTTNSFEGYPLPTTTTK